MRRISWRRIGRQLLEAPPHRLPSLGTSPPAREERSRRSHGRAPLLAPHEVGERCRAKRGGEGVDHATCAIRCRRTALAKYGVGWTQPEIRAYGLDMSRFFIFMA